MKLEDREIRRIEVRGNTVIVEARKRPSPETRAVRQHRTVQSFKTYMQEFGMLERTPEDRPEFSLDGDEDGER